MIYILHLGLTCMNRQLNIIKYTYYIYKYNIYDIYILNKIYDLKTKFMSYYNN